VIRRVAADAGINLALQGISVALGLVIGVALSRLLGAEGLGVYAFAMSLATLLGTASRLGLTTLLVREVAIRLERGDEAGSVGLVSWVHQISLSVSVVVAAVTLAWAATVSTSETAWTVGLAMLVLVFMTATTLRSAALRGLNAVVLASLPLHLVRPVVALAGLGVLTVLAWERPSQAMGAQVLAWMVAGGLALALWRQRAPVVPSTPPSTPRKWLAAAMPLLLLDGLLVTIHHSDILMLKWLATDASTGIYAIVSQLGRLTALVLVAANSVVSPRFAALHEAGDSDGLQQLVRASARGVSLLTVVLALGLLGFGSQVLAFYAPGFEVGYPALAVIVTGQALNAMAGSVGYLLVMTGHDRDVAAVSLVVCALNLTLNLVLIPEYDMVGAALASAISVVAWNGALVVLVRKRLRLNSTALPWPL